MISLDQSAAKFLSDYLLTLWISSFQCWIFILLKLTWPQKNQRKKALVGCSDSEPGSGSTEVAGYPWEILTYAGMHVYYSNSDSNKNALATAFICFGRWKVGVAGTSRQDCRCYLKNEIKTMWGMSKKKRCRSSYMCDDPVYLHIACIPYTIYRICMFFYLFLLMLFSYLPCAYWIPGNPQPNSGQPALPNDLGARYDRPRVANLIYILSRFANNEYINIYDAYYIYSC